MDNRLCRLPEISDHVLSGLKADEALKHKILLSVASDCKKRKTSLRTVIALCCLSAVLVLLCVFTLDSKHKEDIQDKITEGALKIIHFGKTGNGRCPRFCILAGSLCGITVRGNIALTRRSTLNFKNCAFFFNKRMNFAGTGNRNSAAKIQSQPLNISFSFFNNFFKYILTHRKNPFFYM